MSLAFGSARQAFPALSCGARLCKVPVRARSRSDNYAAVLRLQNTQPKDRRIYTAHTGILAEPGAHRMAGQRITGRQNHRYDGTGIMNSN